MRFLYRIFIGLVFWVLIILALFQGISPVYDFTEPRPFSGTTLHNPYQHLDSLDFARNFKKSNLHAHESRKGMPLESMYDYKDGEFMEVYKEAGYEYALVTDHQYINPISPIPAYEHGVNLNNFHVNSLGAESVWWLDIPFMLRTESQMQWQLNKLRERGTGLLSINHPYRWRGGLKEDKIARLQGYDIVEVARNCEGAWDSALSYGNYVMMSATDDSHYPDTINRTMQNRYTMVYAHNKGEVIESMIKGWSYGVEPLIGRSPRGKNTEPRLESVKLFGDTLRITSALKIDSVHFTGQGGEIMQSSASRSYIFKESDTYIRPTLFLNNGMVVWLNPVARISALSASVAPEINWVYTALNWLIIIVIVVLLIILKRRLTRRIRSKGKRRGFKRRSYDYYR